MIQTVTAQSGSYQYEFVLSASADTGALLYDITGLAEHGIEVTVDKLAYRTVISGIAPSQRTLTLLVRILSDDVENERRTLRQVFREGNEVSLTFVTDHVSVRIITGTVESCNNPIFSKESLMTITLICPDSIFYAQPVTKTFVAGVTTFTNPGDVSSSCRISTVLDGTVTAGTASISSLAGVQMTINIVKLNTLVGGILNGDIITVDSGYRKRFELVRGLVTTNIFSAVALPYAWPQIIPGVNTITVAGLGGSTSLVYSPGYGGM